MNANHPTLAFHECIGIGAYGEVYIADSLRPDGIDKRVAVKVLKVGLADGAQAVERLRDEGRMLAILDHPCILLVHDLADILGRTGLITE
jgi:serine/threonine protein kinase